MVNVISEIIMPPVTFSSYNIYPNDILPKNPRT